MVANKVTGWCGSDGSIYIAGNNGGNAFVSKYNSNGNLQWEKDISSHYWNGDIEANAIAIDSMIPYINWQR